MATEKFYIYIYMSADPLGSPGVCNLVCVLWSAGLVDNGGWIGASIPAVTPPRGGRKVDSFSLSGYLADDENGFPAAAGAPFWGFGHLSHLGFLCSWVPRALQVAPCGPMVPKKGPSMRPSLQNGGAGLKKVSWWGTPGRLFRWPLAQGWKSIPKLSTIG